jgi:hypothetical protein
MTKNIYVLSILYLVYILRDHMYEIILGEGPLQKKGS